MSREIVLKGGVTLGSDHVSITEDGKVGLGRDCWLEGAVPPLTADQRCELAQIQINRWLKYAGKNDPIIIERG